MIVIDTNVISEPFKRRREQAVIDWLDRQAPATLYLAAMSLAEVLTGLAIMPQGRSRQQLQDGMQRLLHEKFADRILPFDEAAACAYAHIQANAKASGRHVGVADDVIAAIAMSKGFAVATRDAQPYLAAGLQVIDPWQEAAGAKD